MGELSDRTYAFERQMSKETVEERRRTILEMDDEPASAACWYCGGEGWVITCIDDMCRGIDECIHGDGEGPCPECGGEGME